MPDRTPEPCPGTTARRGLRLARIALLGLFAVGLLLLPSSAEAQPFQAWFNTNGLAQHGYVRVPPNAALNPTTAITVEAWVLFASQQAGEDCRSIAGKNFLQAWWLGRCNGQLRSYFRGGASAYTGGVIPLNQWTHVAAVSDGTNVRHYINGELVLEQPAGGSPTTSSSEMRIGSDVSWERSPAGSLDEVRLWNVVRTQDQLRAAINEPITSAMPGLVGVWALDGNAQNVVGPHDGSVQGAGTGFLTFPVAANCGSSTATSLCLLDRFIVSGKWRTGPPGAAEGTAQVADCPNEGSGLFWFFSAINWEVMVKAVNGCGLNNRYWLFSAATTNVFYRLEVTDVHGAQKIYFNYPGPPAPAVTDTNAFATCP
ncbi:MAG TPA: LamG domain-containing protein [Thermoanaerobaculia bacterium]|nr:LamG domain-containing protein [Thermoanaerobaculia bacterium]